MTATIVLTVIEDGRVVSCETIVPTDVMSLRGSSYWLVPVIRDHPITEAAKAPIVQAPVTNEIHRSRAVRDRVTDNTHYYRGDGQGGGGWFPRKMTLEDYQKLKDTLLDVIAESEEPVPNPGVLAKARLGIDKTEGHIPVGPALQSMAVSKIIKKTPSGWVPV